MFDGIKGAVEEVLKLRGRPQWVYRSGLHLALRTQMGYRPAMVLEDGGGPMVRVRYTADGTTRSAWSTAARWSPHRGSGPGARK